MTETLPTLVTESSHVIIAENYTHTGHTCMDFFQCGYADVDPPFILYSTSSWGLSELVQVCLYEEKKQECMRLLNSKFFLITQIELSCYWKHWTWQKWKMEWRFFCQVYFCLYETWECILAPTQWWPNNHTEGSSRSVLSAGNEIFWNPAHCGFKEHAIILMMLV